MKLIFADPHIEEKAIPELRKIFNEILKYPADELIMLGDFYDKKHPSSQEILFGTELAYEFKKKYKKVVFLVGNHDRTREISAIDYLKYIGINVVDSYIDECNNFYGHFMLHESKLQYGTGRCSIKELKSKYNKIFLGHQHLKQEDYHLGSCRYINFNEAEDEYKQIAIMENNKVNFIRLSSPIGMDDVNSLQELDEKDYKNHKIRLVISSFDQFKREINEIAKYKKLYPEFKVKLDFNTFEDKKVKNVNSSKSKKLQDILKEGLSQIEDIDVRKMLLEQFKGE